jgi:hypothetical protein
MNWIPDLIAGLRDISIVVFLGYGLKLMKQQNELLEREKALKQSEIEVHRATIERLKVLQAPAIARDLEQMTRTADNYADKKRELEKRIAILALESEAAKLLGDVSGILGITAGCLEALALLYKTRDMAVGRALLSGQPLEDDLIVTMLDDNVQNLSATVNQALTGQQPELKNMKELLDEMGKNRAASKSEVPAQGNSTS